MVSVTLLDNDRQWRMSELGLGGREAPREHAFCDVTVRQPGTLIVEDASVDKHFSDNPFVTGDPHLRFYAGHPLRVPGGEQIGALCIMDSTPRTLDERHRALLEDLAQWVQTELSHRTELDDLALIQRAQAPRELPSIPGYTIASGAKPARKLSGDFHDLELTASGLRLSVADVMGKGLGPGIVAAGLRSTLRALGNLSGEFLLILDADQIPDPLILHKTLGYFADDPEVALVQTPQWFTNVGEADPLGSQAPLFYGPIQQGKDGWNAAFFCGSNAVLRREALMQLGIVGYVHDLQSSSRRTLKAAETLLRREFHRHRTVPALEAELTQLRELTSEALDELKRDEPAAELVYRVHDAAQKAARRLAEQDVEQIHMDLESIRQLPVQRDKELAGIVIDDSALEALIAREHSPLSAVESVAVLLQELRVDRPGEAQPIQPLATISVTEDMATAMQLHAMGWRSVYHHEVLAHGLAPEDLRTMLKQRLRWAQGTLQVMLRDNPLVKKGLSAGQRLMYFGTMWTYLSGFAALAYMSAPIVYLTLGVLPVNAWSVDFFARFLPYFLVNQVLFIYVSRGMSTWRGQQYSLALFPLWIKACLTTVLNVVFRQPLDFVVTKKDGKAEGGTPWREIWPQLTFMALLATALVVGLIRLGAGASDGTGTLVKTVWVAYILVVLSVIIQAARYRGPAAAL